MYAESFDLHTDAVTQRVTVATAETRTQSPIPVGQPHPKAHFLLSWAQKEKRPRGVSEPGKARQPPQS